MIYLAFLIAILVTDPLHAATLSWEQPSTGQVRIERATAYEGPYVPVATVPATPQNYVLPTGNWGFYRIVNDRGETSNPIRFTLDVHSPEVTDRIDSLDARLTALETPPAPAGNLTIRQIDGDHVEILCANSLSMRSSGSGLRRIVECIH